MKKVIAIVIGIIALFLAGVAFLYQPPKDKFPANTTVNGTDVSGLSIGDAEKKVSESLTGKDFVFEYKGKSYKVPMSSLTFDMAFETVLAEPDLYQKLRFLVGAGNSYEVSMWPDDSEEFLAQIAKLPICDKSGKESTTDAYVDLSDFDFRVVKEKVGNEIDPRIIKNIAYSRIANGSLSAELTDETIIKQPEIKSDSPEIAERLKYCKDNLSYRIEYETDGKTEVLTPQILDEMVTYSKDGPELKKDRIKEYIRDLAGQYNEYNKTYNFTTHGGSEITVEGVTFGKVLDQDAMIKELNKALEEQKSQKLGLKWAQSKYSGGEGIGNSYIETSISDQHVWLYKGGKCIADCDCVTGMPGHDTSRGVFTVQYVTGPTTLRGSNDDGSKYESPVNCFIPFYGGQGFHGSNGWRSKWGGDIYKTSGSHGCVNCPDAAAKKIADNVSAGYPVVIY